MNNILRRYNHVCPWWLAYTFDNRLRAWMHPVQQILGGYIQPGDTVADIGCGMGYFSIGMAGLVGAAGKVIAVDIQPQLLDITYKRAKKKGLSDRIVLQRCTPGDLGALPPLDFVQTFWMTHEVPDRDRLLNQIHAALKPGGHYLLTEPWLHVSSGYVEKIVCLAEQVGFHLLDRPNVFWSWAALFRK
jgi:ubiquinone/menaquinone biosynthesis C-methylase UbiE